MDAGEQQSLQQFSLHYGVKRLTMSGQDISRDRLVAIFQVVPDTLYLEDDITGETFFPDQRGLFETVRMRERGSFAVLGTFKEHVLASSLSATPSFSSTTTQPCRPWISSGTHHTKPQNPSPRAKSVRRPIYVLEVDDFGKLSEFTTVHVISEGDSVHAVGQTIQEFFSSDDSYTMCDNKGVAFADTPETRGLEFWKMATKLYVIRTEDLAKIKSGRLDTTIKRKRVVPGDNEVLESLEGVELEMRKSSARVAEEVDVKFEELSISLSSINGSLSQIMQQCEILDEGKEKLCELSVSGLINTCLRQAVSCKVCSNLPNTLLAITTCCGQVAGCGPCMQI